ncbi:hypothetical protein [Nocardia miyunensis]|uniref:hypothetical protein n=1 Tax=Nocardia miyunensis TaxID=282684 RepID=UPI000A4A8EAB|nr:hypothetical protein [Nocardia miyunensis]
MSDRNRSRKSGQMAGKAKKGAKSQGQRIERDSDRMIDDQRRDMDELVGGMKREGKQPRSDMKDRDSNKERLQRQ